jgi:hypothetical protein
MRWASLVFCEEHSSRYHEHLNIVFTRPTRADKSALLTVNLT